MTKFLMYISMLIYFHCYNLSGALLELSHCYNLGIIKIIFFRITMNLLR